MVCPFLVSCLLDSQMLLGVIALCLSIAYSQCVPSTGMGDILLGKEYYVCFTLNGNERSVFHPKVDE